MKIFLNLYEIKALILKRSLILSDRITEILSKKRSVSPYVTKMFFSNPDEGFGLYWWSDTKISKLRLCFSILLLYYRLAAKFRKM